MREIKFRGWLIGANGNKMFSAEEMAADQLTLLPTGQFINVSGDSTRLSVIYPRDKFIPLQYTGLKDKNGKEIYEGDILRASPVNLVYEKVFWNPNHACFELEETSEGDFYPLSRYASIHEGIGNIYENPELLEAPHA